MKMTKLTKTQILDNATVCFALDVLQSAGFDVSVDKVVHPNGVLHEIVFISGTKTVESGYFDYTIEVSHDKGGRKKL